ncbi:M61 family peptidase [Arthrospiribacter ruber]|uniref:M61 family peptidase n=1 Tax=Arthrospiribacter ruber TaxID=2487934 RepID=A0A951J028_9BACT|nr:M61 family peptidase [Arthrospiribacter ruber]MBW3470143.1 M61 family peptidase [Arthrospiribacter ruber]
MKYIISQKSKVSQFIQINFSIYCQRNEPVRLQVAAWRPGRYELANFAKNIRGFEIGSSSIPIALKKVSKDQWEFQARESGTVEIAYEYYCSKMDAGSCWTDDKMLYLNFSNFIFAVAGRENESIEVHLQLPKDHKAATALPQIAHGKWLADNYQHLIDSPLLSEKNLLHQVYQVNSSDFHIWLSGSVHFSTEKLIEVFKKFTESMIRDFGDFPAKDYHFIILLLPYEHYHGVEHAFSTVITIGPDIELADKEKFERLIGVSSHELYHFWNVCRIRPTALSPYDLSKEVYLEEGFILEGITTFMGDYYLKKSGYWSEREHLLSLEKKLQRESDNLGWRNQTIIESSFDLWLDGYQEGIPEDKVNIYNRGALIAFCLDTSLKANQSSLSEIMKIFWEKYGRVKKGYSLNDFLEIVKTQSSPSYQLLNELLIKKVDIFHYLKAAFDQINVQIDYSYEDDYLLHHFGIRTNDDLEVKQVHPDAQAYQDFMKGDKLLFLNGNSISGIKNLKLEHDSMITINRSGRELILKLKKEQSQFFPKIILKKG